MDYPTVMDRHCARRANEIDRAVHVKPCDIAIGKAASPPVHAVVVAEELAVVAAGKDTQRSLRETDVVEVHPDREWTVVSVRPVLDVLVPLHFGGPARPLEVQLGMMKLHIRADKVGRDVAQQRLGGEFPVRRMLFYGVD
jgi:hypothetical protein